MYAEAIRTLNEAGVDHVLSGLFAVYAYTGISRPTNDLDLLLEPEQVVDAARALSAAGFETNLAERHWLAKARRGGSNVDLVFGMANGLGFIDEAWKRRGVQGTFCEEAIRIASPEDLIFHRLFITERHRFDMSDIVHLVLVREAELDWAWLMHRIGEHWRLLLAQILFFDFSYPGRRDAIPSWVREDLLTKLREERPRHEGDAEESRISRSENGSGDASGKRARDSEPDPTCMGTLISRFSFAVDVNEWGFRDRRAETVEAARADPAVRRIAESDVWDVRGSNS